MLPLKRVRPFPPGFSRRSWLILATGAALFFNAIPAGAATITWADTGSDFATNADWLLGTAPANSINTDIASFGLVTNFQPNLAAARSVNGLAFTAASTNAVTLTGAVFTIGNSGINNQSTSGLKLINNNLTLGAAQTFTNNGAMTIAGTVNDGGFLLTLGGTGNSGTISGIVSGAGGLTMSASGIWTLSGNNTYTGKTTINSGTLSVNTLANTSASSALGAPTTAANGTIAIGATTTGATLQYTGSGSTTNRVINLAGTTGGATLDSSGTGALNFTSAFTATGAGKKTLTLTGSNTNANTISGAIVNNSAVNTTSLVKSGAGTWVLSGTNTFTGSTTLNGGTLSIGADNNLGTAPGAATANDLIFNGGTLGTTATFTLSANRGATLNAGGGTFDTAAGTTLTYNGIIAGTGGLTKTDTGTLILGGANTFTGATTINGGTLSINADNRLGTAPGSVTADQLVFNGGTLATTATMALNANRSVTLNAGGGTLNVATGTTLTFSSTISGSGSMIKLGAGILQLGATTSMSGTFVLSAGTFALNGFNFSAGTLHITGNTTLDFGNSAASFLNVNNLVIDAGVLLTITNWINAVDYFTVQNDPGGSQGNNPLNQILFSGGSYTVNDTKWLPYDKQITPAPEPAVYGAVLAGCSTLLLAWRRRRQALLA